MIGLRYIALAPFLVSLVGACSQGAPLPALPHLADLGEPNEPARAQGSVMDVYTRIARGAMACWFGADGALKSSHIFHADVAPPSRGGAAEITLHRIEPDQPSPWGRRAFRVKLDPVDGATAIAVESLGLPDDLARRMRADVFQWIEGKPACSTRESPSVAGLTGGSASAPGTSSRRFGRAGEHNQP